VRFLVIDDSPADRELIVRKLRREFTDATFLEVSRPPELEAAIDEGKFDFVLTDYQLNWIDGLKIFNRLHEKYPDIPVVMFTGTGNEEVAVEGLRAGLSNYVLKQNLDHLPFAIHDSMEKARLRKQYDDAIQQLRASEERYRELFEEGLTGVFAFTVDGTLLTCNPAFAHIFGFASVEEAMKVSLQELYGDLHYHAQFMALLRQQKRLAYHSMEMKRRDSLPIYVVANVVGTFDEHGNLLEAKGYLFDHTEQQKLAGQLQQAQKLESVGLLVSGIAHDFNNMLGGILGYSSRSLSQITRSHPLYNNLHHIQDIATRAARMTQQLLAFSRRQVLEPTDLNLNDVVANLLSFIGKILVDHIEIVFHPASSLRTVHVDYSQIEQVLMNLCINARDAMPDGGTLTIRTCNVGQEEAYRKSGGQLSSDSYVQISVQDTGVGMSAEVQSHLFEPFFTTKEVGKGTGLGLSMVHGIVGQHNGYINVISMVGKGTTFEIYLPSVDSKPSLLTVRDNVALPVQGGNETLLVVEDDPDLRYLMEEALSDYGYTVLTASDGSEGLQIFEKYRQSIALVVSDLITPKMRGKELYDRIHHISPATKFLFVSGYQANQISQNFVLDRAFAFLQKPFDLDDLASKVREIVAEETTSIS
jgi:PAS domain S-box-containing protein